MNLPTVRKGVTPRRKSPYTDTVHHARGPRVIELYFIGCAVQSALRSRREPRSHAARTLTQCTRCRDHVQYVRRAKSACCGRPNLLTRVDVGRSTDDRACGRGHAARPIRLRCRYGQQQHSRRCRRRCHSPRHRTTCAGRAGELRSRG